MEIVLFSAVRSAELARLQCRAESGEPAAPIWGNTDMERRSS